MTSISITNFLRLFSDIQLLLNSYHSLIVEVLLVECFFRFHLILKMLSGIRCGGLYRALAEVNMLDSQTKYIRGHLAY